MSNNCSSINVRLATKEDAPFLGWVVLHAAQSHLERGFFEFELPDMTEEERISLLQEIIASDEPSFIRWDGFLIAEVDGVPAAGLSGYETKLKSGELFDSLLVAGLRRRGWTESAIDELHKRSYDVLAVWPNLHGVEHHWVVEWVATRPEYRRRGLVNQLLTRVLDIGREKGYKRAQVSVVVGNDAALKAYEKQGFSEYSTITSPLISRHINTAGVINLRMDL